jgi:hypothetical protein
MPFLGISEAPDDVAVLSPSTLDVHTAFAIVQGDYSSRDALCSRRPHWTFTPLSPSCRAIVQVETRSYCVHGARCPSLASSRRRCCALAVHTGRLYRSRHRAGRLFKSRRALIAFTVLNALLWRQATAAAVLSPSTLDVNTALAIVQGDCSSRDALLLRSRCSYPSLASSRRRCCALAVHTGRLYRSRHRAGRLFKSRRALIAFTVLNALLWRQAAAAAVLSPSTLDVNTALAIVQGDYSSRDALLLRSRCSMPFFGVKPLPLLCSRRPHWTLIPLSPSCRAIIQVETRSYCIHGARTLLWRQATAAAVLSPSQLDVYSRSRHRAGRLFKSRRALIAFTVLDALLWRQAAAAAVLSLSKTKDVYTALAVVQGDCSSRDALLLNSGCSMPFFGVKPPPLLCSRRPHRTLIPLSPSCRAIVQVETRSYCVHGARCPFLASSRRRCCALAVHIGRLFPLSPSCRAIVQVETRSYCVHGARCLSLASSRRRCCALAVHIGR